MQLKRRLSHLVSISSLTIILLLLAGIASGQSAPTADAKEEPAAPDAAKVPTVQAPGLDASGVPLYKTIVEDWSSLQIGDSRLFPLPAEVTPPDEQEHFTRQLVRLQWRPGDPIDLWVIKPKGLTKPPAVLYLYNVTEDATRFRNDTWCERVTYGGVAAIGFVSALTAERFHDRPMKQWFVSEMQESLGSTVHDVKFIIDYLAQRNDIDMDRIGMFGEGSGGAIAILAAAADSRIKAVDALDPWGDWPEFLAKSPVVLEDPEHGDYVKPEFLKKVAPLDPVKWLPQLKIPVRIIQLRDNEATPIECKTAITSAAPSQTDIVRYATSLDMAQRTSEGRLFGWVKEKLQQSGKSTSAPGGAKSGAEEHPPAPAASSGQKASQR